MNLSTIPAAAQKYANDCIDASARIILSHSGVNMTEDQLMSVIAPGGSIESQAAGLNKLNPGGGYRAMQGSGGSPGAMFDAIKASIDNGSGSILNVAPGSSIAGNLFSEGHFIAATGYNPDGSINLTDSAKGTKYSVSAADAFQATRGRGIVAGTGSGPSAAPGAAPPFAAAAEVAESSGSAGSLGGTRASTRTASSSFASTGPSGSASDPLFVVAAGGGGVSGGFGGGGGSASAGGFGGDGGVMSQLGGIVKDGLTESFLPQGFSDPSGWPMMKSAMGVGNFIASLTGGIPDPTGGFLTSAASSFGLPNLFNPTSGSPKLAPGEFNPAVAGGSGGSGIAGLASSLSGFAAKGGGGDTMIDNSTNVSFPNTSGKMPVPWQDHLQGVGQAKTRATTGPMVP